MYGTYQRLRAPTWASDCAVIKLASRKIKRAHRFAREYRDGRHAFYRAMLAYHHDWQATCRKWRM